MTQMEQSELRKTTLAYLESCSALSLATHGKDGPWAASVFYFNQGLDLYFLSNPTSRHGENIAQNPLVSATINLDCRKWTEIKGIQLEGRAQLLGSVARHLDLARDYVARFPEVKDFLLAPHKLTPAIAAKVLKVKFYKLTPTRIFYLDNALGFGNRQELLI